MFRALEQGCANIFAGGSVSLDWIIPLGQSELFPRPFFEIKLKSEKVLNWKTLFI